MNLIESEVGMTILHMYNTPPPPLLTKDKRNNDTKMLHT